MNSHKYQTKPGRTGALPTEIGNNTHIHTAKHLPVEASTKEKHRESILISYERLTDYSKLVSLIHCPYGDFQLNHYLSSSEGMKWAL
jgi:hypothetical protein